MIEIPAVLSMGGDPRGRGFGKKVVCAYLKRKLLSDGKDRPLMCGGDYTPLPPPLNSTRMTMPKMACECGNTAARGDDGPDTHFQGIRSKRTSGQRRIRILKGA